MIRKDKPASTKKGSVKSEYGVGTPPKAPPLPEIINAADLLNDSTVTIPSEVIRGVLFKGTKMVLGANSKSNKTWTLLDLALSISTGTTFWNWETIKGKVLIVDFELPAPFIRQRLKAVAQAKGIDDLANIDVWALRGHATSLETLEPKLRAGITAGNYSLVIIDPVYKLLGGQDENSAGVIGNFCNQLESIITPSGAALVYAAHFAKGNASMKESIDRISGSGATGRDGDTIMTLTKHEEDGAFAVELTMRLHAPKEPFVVSWEYPLMKVRGDLSAEYLKQAKSNGKCTKSKTDVMPHVQPNKPISQASLMSKLQASHIGLHKARGFIAELVEDGALFEWSKKRPGVRNEVWYAREKQPSPELFDES